MQAKQPAAISVYCVASDSGNARIDHCDTVVDVMQAQQKMGELPENRGYTHIDTRDNIRYYGKLHGMKGSPGR